MKNHESFIHGIQIATPCNVSWDSMTGDERTRHCHSCQLSVYNIAAMSTAEAEELILGSEGRLCLRIYRRKDGTVITKDCPKGLQAIRDRYYRCAAGMAALVSVCAMYVMSLVQPNSPVCARAEKLKAVAKAVQAQYTPSNVAGGMRAPVLQKSITPANDQTRAVKMNSPLSADEEALEKIQTIKNGKSHD